MRKNFGFNLFNGDPTNLVILFSVGLVCILYFGILFGSRKENPQPITGDIARPMQAIENGHTVYYVKIAANDGSEPVIKFTPEKWILVEPNNIKGCTFVVDSSLYVTSFACGIEK